MAYTVKEVEKLSGVSVRTLHFYDEIGLLKPAYYGKNAYRYYEEEQLLKLQQILFFRELGFSLTEIKRIVNANDFDKIEALKSHKKVLKGTVEHTRKLIKTIDTTLAHLEGKSKMKHEDLYYGFDSEKQKRYEKYLIEKGICSEETILESHEKVKGWESKDWDKFKMEGDILHQAFAKAIDQGLSPDSPEVQRLVQKHYQMYTTFGTATKEGYVGLGQLYSEHPDFRKFYEAYHPKLLEFLKEAMRIYTERNL